MKDFIAAMGACLFVSQVAFGGLGNIATEQGLSPEGLATANAGSMFSDGASAAFYNPASLANGQSASFCPGLVTVSPRIERIGPDSRSELPAFSGYSTLGIKLDLGSGFGLNRRVNFGLNLAVAGFGRDILSFGDAVVEEGQELRYGKKPMFFNIGVGLQITDRLSFGLGTLATVDGEAQTELHVETDGSTTEQKFTSSGRTRTFPIAGLRYQSRQIGVSLSYHSESYYHLKLNANNYLRVLADGSLPIKMDALDTYTPETFSLGLMGILGDFRGFLSVEIQRYSAYAETVAELSTVQGESELSLEDVVVPRIGGRYQLTPSLAASAGLSYEASPLKGDVTSGVNYVDHDRLSLGLGADYLLASQNGHPISIGLGGQVQKLEKRQIRLNYPTLLVPDGNQDEKLSSEGYATSLSLSLTSQL